MAEALDPLGLPLQGSQLIEASAGTGKTWTIAALVLRLVLGHAAPGQSLARPLQPAQILVMTFTRAATRELSDRIRDRLAAAARVFRGEEAAAVGDAVLAGLLDAYPEGAARAHAAWLLAGAAESMDAAAIHTLDAWCQRVLREQGFETALSPDLEVLPDGASLRLEAAQDVWRSEILPLRGAALDLALGIWSSPQDMAEDLRFAAERPVPDDWADRSLAERIGEMLARLAALKAGWAERLEPMRSWLLGQVSLADPPLAGNKVSRAIVERWWQAMQDWLADGSAVAPALSDAVWKNLSASGLRSACKAKRQVEPPAMFEDYERLLETLRAWPDPAPALRAHAVAAITRRMDALKALRGWRSHLDAQRLLAYALDERLHGDRARRLRQRLRTLYPAALVDEFQDTSPLQLAILERIYGIAANDPETALLLIGDPKQSIYGFRGADIHSYLRARRATEGRHHALTVNHRSAAGVVAGVQAVFARAEQRSGPGAFGFRSADDDPLPFVSVTARGRPERLMREGRDAVPVTLCLDPREQNAQSAQELAAERCAQVIADWLTAPDAGFAGPDGAWRRLSAGDTAVLVRSRTEATRLRRALQRRGLPSVFLSDRDAVFQTAEAAEVWRLLRAMAQPRDERRLRAVLAGGLLGLTMPQLLALFDDEWALDAEALRLAELQRVWRSQGVLAAIRAALHAWGMPGRWLQEPDGERRLTNVLHLAELLQAASATHPGEAGLLRWLSGEIEGSGEGSDEAQEAVLRLESDADRIQVVTVHQSKGLEYPMVFLPFATAVRTGSRDARWAAWPADGQGQRELVLDPPQPVLDALAEDARREDLRLLYVALTRARHLLWVGLSTHGLGVAREPAWPRSAIGRLISGPDAPTTEQAIADLQALQAASPDIALAIADGPDDPALVPVRRASLERPPQPLPEPAPYAGRIDRRWAIHSYTALLRERSDGLSSPAMAAGLDDGVIRSQMLRADEPVEAGAGGVRDDESPSTAAPMDGVPPAAGGAMPVVPDTPGGVLAGPGATSADTPWHRFPRGPLAGHFLHTQLEWLAGEGFALAREPALLPILERRCEQQGWGHRAADVLPWMARLCETRLPPVGAALGELSTLLAEMEFWLPADGLDVAWLDAACRQHLLPGVPRAPLGAQRLRGLLMGFADLVFEHGGRYWVLDHKSNALGADDAAYHPAALQAAVAAHRYDVQAALYLLPLHRLLRTRLGAAYDPARQLGGAVFLFLRGVAAPGAGCCHLAPPLALLEALDARLPAGAGEGLRGGGRDHRDALDGRDVADALGGAEGWTDPGPTGLGGTR